MNHLPKIYLGIIEGNHWEPGIGDPTIMGWVTVFAYLITAFLCGKCGQNNQSDRWLWWTFSGILLLLGINKQLDLQSWLTIVGKTIAIEQGWYAQRRLVQEKFILGLIAFSFASLMFLIQAMGKNLKKFILPLSGLFFY